MVCRPGMAAGLYGMVSIFMKFIMAQGNCSPLPNRKQSYTFPIAEHRTARRGQRAFADASPAGVVYSGVHDHTPTDGPPKYGTPNTEYPAPHTNGEMRR